MRAAARWSRNSTAAKQQAGYAAALPTAECTPKADASLPEGQTFRLDGNAPMRELLPGFVHMQGVLPLSEQQALLELSCSVAAESRQAGNSGGWYRLEQGGRWSLNDGTKARFWDSITRFPKPFKDLGEDLAKLAAHRFPSELSRASSEFEPRVGALNYYTSKGRMGWHVDDTNFAKAGRPIVMANVGDAADFGYKMRKSDPDQSVRLESGDVIVFGGAARDIVHAMLQVHPQTSPAGLQFPELPGHGRVSITWRDVGVEDGLTFNSDERLGLVVSEHALPRYRKGGPNSGGSGKTCAQCSAVVNGQGNIRGPVYCQDCWRAWQKR